MPIKWRASHNEDHPTMDCDIGCSTSRDMVWRGLKEQDEVTDFCETADRTTPAIALDGKWLRPIWLTDRNFHGHDSLRHPVEAGA